MSGNQLARVAVGYAGSAHALALPTRAFRVRIGGDGPRGSDVTTMVYELPDRVVIPINAQLPDGGFVRGAFEVDPRTFHTAVALCAQYGVVPKLSDMLEHFTGAKTSIVSFDPRPLLARNAGGGDW